MKLRVYWIALSAATLAGTGVGNAQVPSQFTEWSDLNYREKVVELCRTHIDNHKVISKKKMWDMDRNLYKESKFDSYTTTAVYGVGTWLQISNLVAVGGEKVEYAQYMDRDASYHFQSINRKRPFEFKSHAYEWRNPIQYLNSFSIFAATSQVYPVHPGEKLLGHEPSTFEGRDALKLTLKGQHGILKTVYLDRTTYQWLYAEADKSFDYGIRGPIDEKSITRFTYRDAHGKRLPVRYEHYQVTASGQKRMIIEVEFTEYEPYNPKPDDLDLEKKFGARPITYETRPDPSKPPEYKRFTSIWWYIAAGALLVFVISVVFLVRRRSRAAN